MKRLLLNLILLLALGCIETDEQKIERIQTQLREQPDPLETKKSLNEIVNLLLDYERRESSLLGKLIAIPATAKDDANSNQNPKDTEDTADTQNPEETPETADTQNPEETASQKNEQIQQDEQRKSSKRAYMHRISHPHRNRWRQSFSDGGKTFAWLEENHLMIRTEDKIQRYRLPDHVQQPTLNISAGGRYMTMLSQPNHKANEKPNQTDQSKCPVFVTENTNHPLAESQQKRGFRKLPVLVGCTSPPVLSEDSSRFYYVQGGNVRAINFLEDAETTKGKIIINKETLKNPNSKLPPQIYLQQINADDLLVFYGSSGNYHVYFYGPSEASKESEKAKKLNTNSALPYLFLRSKLWPTAYARQKTSAAAQNTALPAGNGFFLAGKTGKYRLFALDIVKWRATSLFSTPASEFAFYAENIDRYYQLVRGQLHIYNPQLKENQPLPLLAQWVGPFADEGLLTIRHTDERIFLRKRPFTEIEVKLIEIYHRELKRINES